MAPSRSSAARPRRARTKSWAGSDTGGTRDPLVQSRGETGGTTSVRIGLGVEVEVSSAAASRDAASGRSESSSSDSSSGAAAWNGEIELDRSVRVMASASAGIAAPLHQQRRISQHLCGAHRALGPVMHRLISRAVELVERQLDQQLDGLDRGRLRGGREELSPGARGPARIARADALWQRTSSPLSCRGRSSCPERSRPLPEARHGPR